MTLPLVVFDLDGTLTETYHTDARAFVATVREHLGDIELDMTWESYPHASDTGLVDSLWREAHGRAPLDHEVSSFRTTFVDRLEADAASSRTSFRLVDGANQAIATLADAGHPLALATGCFEVTARLKVRHSGLDLRGMPGAFSEDGPSREEILRAARSRGGAHERVVYVGDAVWDARTCRALGWPLVGRATGARADRLRREGVTHVLPDWRDLDALLTAVAAAGVPKAAAG